MAKPYSVSKVLRPLIILPVTIIVDIGLVVLGYFIDKSVYNPPTDTPSFMFPAFTLILMIIAAIISFIALVVMIVLIIVRLSKYSKTQNSLDS